MSEPTVTYRLLKQWSLMMAAYHYVLYIKEQWPDGQVTHRKLVSAPRFTDAEHRDWAERQAEHFGIEIEDSERISNDWGQKIDEVEWPD